MFKALLHMQCQDTTMHNGFRRWKRCAQLLVLNQLCLVDVAGRLIVPILSILLPHNLYFTARPLGLKNGYSLIHIIKKAILGLYVVLSIMVKTRENCSKHISRLAKVYRKDFPSSDVLPSEVHCWWMKWQKELSDHGEASLPIPQTLHPS